MSCAFFRPATNKRRWSQPHNVSSINSSGDQQIDKRNGSSTSTESRLVDSTSFGPNPKTTPLHLHECRSLASILVCSCGITSSGTSSRRTPQRRSRVTPSFPESPTLKHIVSDSSLHLRMSATLVRVLLCEVPWLEDHNIPDKAPTRDGSSFTVSIVLHGVVIGMPCDFSSFTECNEYQPWGSSDSRCQSSGDRCGVLCKTRLDEVLPSPLYLLFGSRQLS